MQNPTLWLDILVCLSVVLCIGLSINAAFVKPSPRRGKYKLWSGYAFCAAFFLGGFDSLLTDKIADRTVSNGIITALEQHSGRNAYSRFVLTGQDETQWHLRIDSNSNILRIGERVRANWLLYNGKVMRVDVLDGSNKGEHLDDGSRFFASLEILLGTWFVYGFQRSWHDNPSGKPNDRSGQQPPLNGIDEKSLLNLNNP